MTDPLNIMLSGYKDFNIQNIHCFMFQSILQGFVLTVYKLFKKWKRKCFGVIFKWRSKCNLYIWISYI